MEWSNAKKFVIVLLVLLNVLLAGLNYKQNRENTMTAAQERSIFEVLSRNGITMYTDLLTEHPPMSRLAGYGMDGVVNVSVCTGIGEADIISVWAGCKSISCACQGSS